ncbi:MAG: MerR family transcriptional regulator, partial [Desulfovibrionaceae bacterium]|nr:MerR family transcriptional regulator [Desulfovibrionaceae bacterium]
MTNAKTYKIGQVAELTGLKAFVLRFWESEFPQLTPIRTPKGQRLYTGEHLALIERIRALLYADGLTIEGARRRLADAAKDGQIESAARRAQGKSALLGEVERELKGILG